MSEKDTVTDNEVGGEAASAPSEMRVLLSPTAVEMRELCAGFEDLQTVLRCCEELMTALGADEPDGLVVEALWTVALMSYARCFTPDGAASTLTEKDLAEAQPHGDVLEWHSVLMKLRKHYADPEVNPRERFTVGVTQGDDGAVQGVAITSTRQPLVDNLTVRQLGAIAFSLSDLVNRRLATRQQALMTEVSQSPASVIDRLTKVELVAG